MEISKIPNVTDYQHISIVHFAFGITSFHAVKFFDNINITIYASLSFRHYIITLYYYRLSEFVSSKKILLEYGTVISSTCSLYGRNTDSRRHFPVECDIIWRIWE
ncbi:hypothetical protein BDF21DRAFT_393991 [Thamnidium elegans]|nr:hypothetical protein BDF21DRAFT_393991 [Thamnidium elegans]